MSISFSATGSLPEGEYRLTAIVDGVTHSCSQSTGPASALECQPALGPLSVYLASRQTQGVLPPGASPDTLYIDLTDAPRSIELEVSHDGTVVAAETFTPSYVTTRPNGDDCPPVCRLARIEAAPLAFE